MSNAPSSALAAIRAATHSEHARLETSLQVIPRLRAPDERQALVDGYGRMFRYAAVALRPWLDDGSGPWRHSASFDRAADQPVSLSGVPALCDRAEALGFHYVMEGSALGGRTILQALARDGVDTTGLDFLNPHGRLAGEAWRSTLALLDRELSGDPAATERATVGARKGYAFAEACLSRPAA